jgi:FAD/FMN-containing dehydrogenase
MNYSSFGSYPKSTPSGIIYPKWHDETLLAFKEIHKNDSLLPYGMGRSYGDSCLNNDHSLLLTKSLNNIISFDAINGNIECESGCTFDEILQLIVPKGWFLPVTPGTRFITVGGAIANDIHGKNHSSAGNFGNHVQWFYVFRSDYEQELYCSQDINQDLYMATIGGLGLTGIITKACFSLKKIDNPYINVECIKFKGIDEFLDLSETLGMQKEYSVSWFDCYSGSASNIKGLFTAGTCADQSYSNNNIKAPKSITFPFDAPGFLLNTFTIKAFNALYYHKQLNKAKSSVQHYEPFFYPLDAIHKWNRMYGKRGFVQYQNIIPFESGIEPINDILSLIKKSGEGSFLVVLKTFGSIQSRGMMSFPKPGITLAMDFPWNGAKTATLLDAFDTITAEAKGRVYPAKDARMSGKHFRQYFPNWERFMQYKDPCISSSFIRRVLA